MWITLHYKESVESTERYILYYSLIGGALILRQREKLFITKVIPFNQYVFYPSLVDYKLRYVAKKQPKYFSIMDDIKEKENSGR